MFLKVSALSENISLIDGSRNTITGTTKYVITPHATANSPARSCATRLSLDSTARRMTPTTAAMADQASSGPLRFQAVAIASRMIGSPPPNAVRVADTRAAEKNDATNVSTR